MVTGFASEVDVGGRKPNCSELRVKGKKYIGFLSTRLFPPNRFLLSGLAIRTLFLPEGKNGLFSCKNF